MNCSLQVHPQIFRFKSDSDLVSGSGTLIFLSALPLHCSFSNLFRLTVMLKDEKPAHLHLSSQGMQAFSQEFWCTWQHPSISFNSANCEVSAEDTHVYTTILQSRPHDCWVVCSV